MIYRIYSNITYEFIWFPTFLTSSNGKGMSLVEFKWLVWTFREHKYPKAYVGDIWSSKADYILYYDIATGISRKDYE